MTLGEQIKAQRKQAGLTQEKLAEKLEVSRQAVTKWEADQAAPSADKLIALAALFNTSIDDMMALKATGKESNTFSDLRKQDRIGDEKSRTMKAGYIAYHTIQVAVLLYFVYELYLRVKIGRPISNLLIYFLLLTAPAKIYKNTEARNARKGNAEDLKQHDKMIVRFLLLSIGIVAVFVTVTVLYVTRSS